MSDPRTEPQELRAALAALSNEAAEPGGHLDADELAAYHAGELAPGAESRAQEHLLRCAECAELLLDLDRLQEGTLGDPGPASDEEVEAVWEALRPNLRKAPAANVVPMRRPERGDRTGSPVRPRWLETLAAALALGVVGLSLWVVQLRGTVGTLTAPQLNTPVHDLSATPRRDLGAPPAVVHLPPGGRLFTVVLSPEQPGTFPDYALEIATPGGRKVWSGAGLQPNEFGLFTVTLNRDLVPPGRWHLRLDGLSTPGGGERTLLGEYALEVAAR